jgi:hydroxyacylglutathione hydrolase
MIDVHQFPVLADNYAFLVRCQATGAVTTIDTPDADAILAEATRLGWAITDIWNTHWHPDHAGGNAAIVAATGARVTGPAEVSRIAAQPDLVVAGGETVRLGAAPAQVIDVGGHTLGHVAFWFDGADIAFVGDTIFALGCGRLFEGTPAQMWASFGRLTALPEATTLYCAHEYTASNLRYALHVDPDNAALKARGEDITRLRAAGLPTVPTTLAAEIATNPFLRAGDAARFAALRAGKDVFKG